MKILMVLESDFPPDTRVENEIKALTGAGHTVHIACISRKKEFTTPTDLGYTIHKAYMPKLVYKASVGALETGIYFRFWSRFLKRVLKKEQFDTIHIHDLPLARPGYELSRKFGIKMTLDLHENWPALLNISLHTKTLLGRILSSQKQWIAYEKECVLHADQIIVVVEEAKERIAKLGVDKEKIFVVSNTINPDHFDFPPPSKDENYITMVYGGGVTYHRGLQAIIQALPELVKEFPNIRLWIIGPGSYLPVLKKLAADLGVSDKVTFYGWKPLKELLQIQSQADIALIPHLKSPHTDSTIPHKLFQYMYAGIPIITSDCIPLKRIVEETETGLAFKNLDPESFADRFRTLMDDKYFREQIPAHGKEWVEKKYNWNNDAEVLKGIYAMNSAD